jgi:hypothetical protein
MIVIIAIVLLISIDFIITIIIITNIYKAIAVINVLSIKFIFIICDY